MAFPSALMCPRAGYCKTLPIWEGLNTLIRDYLDGITLQDIVDQNAADVGMYVI